MKPMILAVALAAVLPTAAYAAGESAKCCCCEDKDKPMACCDKHEGHEGHDMSGKHP